MASAFLDVTDRVALAIPRRDDGPAHQRNVDLPAMGMPGQGDGHARRHQGKDVGIVGEDDDGLCGRNGARGSRGIRGARVEVGQPDEPERVPAVPEARRFVVEDHDAGRAERARHARAVVPPVVVAEHGEDAERRAKWLQPGRRHLGLDPSPPDHPVHDEVPQQHHEVGPALVDEGDDAVELLGADVRGARVQVRHDGDGERGHLPRPRGKRELDILDDEAAGLDEHGPHGEGEAEGEEPDRADDERSRAESRHRASLGACWKTGRAPLDARGPVLAYVFRALDYGPGGRRGGGLHWR